MSKSPSTPKADLPEAAANEGSKGGPIVCVQPDGTWY